MKEKLDNFFRGRYGTDNYNKFLLYVALFFAILRLFVKSDILYFFTIALLVYSNFRIFSKNIYARSDENTKYLSIRNSIVKSISWFFLKIFGKDGYKYLECESCKAELKVPKGKGKLKVKCPKCGHEMVVRS